MRLRLKSSKEVAARDVTRSGRHRLSAAVWDHSTYPKGRDPGRFDRVMESCARATYCIQAAGSYDILPIRLSRLQMQQCYNPVRFGGLVLKAQGNGDESLDNLAILSSA